MSKHIILLIVVVIVVALCTTRVMNNFTEVVYVKSDNDNNKYKIRRGKQKSQYYLKESANALSEINTRIQKLIQYMQEKYKYDDSKMYFIQMLAKNYHPDLLSEAAVDNRYTTFTVDKQDMHICLRTRDTNEKLYDINILMYVILHELAHLCNYNRNGIPIIGHGREFINIFKLLVINAIKIGVYEYRNYSKDPQEYCGIVINTSVVSEFDH